MSNVPMGAPPSYDEAFANPRYEGGYSQPGGAPYPASATYGGNYNTAYSDNYSNPAQPAPQPPTYFPPPIPRVEPKEDDNDVFSDASLAGFSDKAIRRAFIRKVYLILMTQLLVTVAFICFFMFVEPVKTWIQRDGSWFYFVSYATFLVTYFVLICIPSVRRNTPGNYICLAVFTFAFSYMTGTIASFHSTSIVLIAAGITALVCLSISLFAIQTKIDFTMCSGLLFVLCMVLFFFGWSCLIVFYTSGPNYILQCVYGGLAALVFGLFLVYDTQMIVGGRKHELSPEEYIYGALQLYIDVVYLFLIILSLFGKSN